MTRSSRSTQPLADGVERVTRSTGAAGSSSALGATELASLSASPTLPPAITALGAATVTATIATTLALVAATVALATASIDATSLAAAAAAAAATHLSYRVDGRCGAVGRQLQVVRCRVHGARRVHRGRRLARDRRGEPVAADEPGGALIERRQHQHPRGGLSVRRRHLCRVAAAPAAAAVITSSSATFTGARAPSTAVSFTT